MPYGWGQAMKTKINDHGRVVIPAAYRKALNLAPGDEVEIMLEGGGLKIVPRKRGRLLDLAGCIVSDRPFPTKKDIRAAAAQAAADRLTRSQDFEAD